MKKSNNLRIISGGCFYACFALYLVAIIFMKPWTFHSNIFTFLVLGIYGLGLTLLAVASFSGKWFLSSAGSAAIGIISVYLIILWSYSLINKIYVILMIIAMLCVFFSCLFKKNIFLLGIISCISIFLSMVLAVLLKLSASKTITTLAFFILDGCRPKNESIIERVVWYDYDVGRLGIMQTIITLFYILFFTANLLQVIYRCKGNEKQSSQTTATNTSPVAIERLNNLKELLDQGVITRDDFESKKKEIMQSLNSTNVHQ